MSEIFSALLLLPLVGALLVSFFKNPFGRHLALGISVLHLALSIYLLWGFNPNEALQCEINLPWLKNIQSRLHFGVDGMGLFFLLLVNLLIPLVILSSFNQKKAFPSNFYALILMMQFGLMGVFTAFDGLLFYLFWEITLIPIWFISGLWGQEDKRIKVTTKFFVYTFSGSLFMLIGLIYLYHHAASFDLKDLYQAHLNLKEQTWVFWLIFIAFAVKLPLFPLHTWLPDTHTYAPSQGSMLLSGIMLKMAIYGILRYLLPFSGAVVAGFSGQLVVALALVGVLYGALIAMVQHNVKTIIAYSSISHLGMMVAGIFVSAILTFKGQLDMIGVEGALLQTFAHAVNAVGLFYCADILYQRTKSKDLRNMGGLALKMPKMAVGFMILVLGSVALPLTNGFVGEFFLLKAMFSYDIVVAIVGGSSIILGAVYMFRMYGKAMFGKGHEETLKDINDLSRVESFVLFCLVAWVILLGIFPHWILDMVKPSLESIFTLMLKAS